MSTILSKGENVRQALKWISSEIIDNEEKELARLINDASIRFNLSPKEEDFLRCFYSDQKERDSRADLF